MNEVTGDFEFALHNMIIGLKDRLPHETILRRWDTDRGTDWYTGTKQWLQAEGKWGYYEELEHLRNLLKVSSDIHANHIRGLHKQYQDEIDIYFSLIQRLRGEKED